MSSKLLKGSMVNALKEKIHPILYCGLSDVIAWACSIPKGRWLRVAQIPLRLKFFRGKHVIINDGVFTQVVINFFMKV